MSKQLAMNEQPKQSADEKVFEQWRRGDEDAAKKVFVRARVVRPFFLKIEDGPSMPIPAAALVDLWDLALVSDLFYTGKIDPVTPGIPDLGEYVVSRQFVCVDDRGLYQTIAAKTILKLSRVEALVFLRRGLVRPIDKNVFYIG